MSVDGAAQGGGSDGSADEDEDDEIHSDSEEVGWTAEDEEESGSLPPTR